jgi:glycosyltransferase involved in cell wall biosynthesis
MICWNQTAIEDAESFDFATLMAVFVFADCWGNVKGAFRRVYDKMATPGRASRFRLLGWQLKMNVLHVTTDTNFGGVQQCILGICRHSAVYGHPFTHHVVRVAAGGLESRFRLHANLHDAGPNYENTLAVIQAIRPDIIHMHMPGGRFPEYCERIASTGVPLIESIHCVNGAAPREEEVMRARIVNSQYVYGLQASKEKLHIIPHAIDEEEWALVQAEGVKETLLAVREKELGVSRDSKAVGRIGNITKWKKPADFVHTVPPILRGMKPDCPRPAFFLAGAVHENPAYAAGLVRTAKMLFVEDKIRFLWNVERKFAFLGMLDIFLYPTSQEGYCIAAIEAMSMGLPVITYDDSAMPETVPPAAGVIVPKGDIQKLADAVLSLIENPHLLREKSDAARALVKRRNMPETVFCQYEQIYAWYAN